MDADRCKCPCHKGSLFDEPPEMSDAIASLSACELCAPLHAGVWTVVPRGWKNDELGDESGG